MSTPEMTEVKNDAAVGGTNGQGPETVTQSAENDVVPTTVAVATEVDKLSEDNNVVSEATAQPVVAQVTTSPVVQAATSAAVDNVSTANNISTVGKLVLSGIDTYIFNMMPGKPISDTAGIRNQIALFRTLSMMLSNVFEDFNLVYSEVLKKFHDGRNDVFHEINVFRFFESIPISATERKVFMSLLNLIKVTADPASRAISLKQVDMNKNLKYLTEEAKNKLLNFYHL